MSDAKDMADALTQTIAEMTQHLAAQTAAMREMALLAAAPKRIVRNPLTGRAEGVEVAQ